MRRPAQSVDPSPRVLLLSSDRLDRRKDEPHAAFAVVGETASPPGSAAQVTDSPTTGDVGEQLI